MISFLKRAWNEAGEALAYDLVDEKYDHQISGPRPTHTGYFLLVLTGIAHQQLMERIVCWWRGHNMRDVGSYAGPECAQDMHECRRCGFYFEHTYY